MRALTILAAAALTACSAPAEPAAVRKPPDETLIETPSRPEPPPLSEAAQAKVEQLRELSAGRSLRALARLADSESGFRSNFGGERHYDHWYLLRRTGVDPLEKLAALLLEPHASVNVGDELWHVWPDLAARAPDELAPERLSFRDRARLRDLVGDDGIEQIRTGDPFPGFRLAVSDSGRWVYFLHEIGNEEPTR